MSSEISKLETFKRAIQLYVNSLEILSCAIEEKEIQSALVLELCRNKVKYNYDQVKICLCEMETCSNESEFGKLPFHLSAEVKFRPVFNSASEYKDVCSLLDDLKSLSVFSTLMESVTTFSSIDIQGNIILDVMEGEESDDPEFFDDEEDDAFSPLQIVLYVRLLALKNSLSVAIKANRIDGSKILQCEKAHKDVLYIMEKLQRNKEHFVDLNRANRDSDTVYVIQDLMTYGCLILMFNTYKHAEDGFAKYQYELNRMMEASIVAREFFR